ncbi:UDP-N-acetylmuramoyl-tripeptide--D-alanyl-D-alanine ligase [Candidatus Epulonipiscium viviparus]|uniref:UDP-N-acetylmuramoyl-tripeptide--D-alanyl-D- alanine ligase n=1 Tax=Candidatus Epulonipiscium viviparus TaxID=420336 RepID=UPI0027380891|nr:UDP-N-acetylmuramoyl-tripeptide--D-alanyl-D-alanine ligase [Candidatus Epulopiscium viviparus]
MQISIQELVQETGGICLNSEDSGNTVIEEIFTDSRQKVNKGLFVPLIGEKFNGHDYIDDVKAMGAIATLTSKENDSVHQDLITIAVEDTQKALLDVARYYSSKVDRPIIAITGSVGKTTTKEMVAAVLETTLKVHKTVGNYNNEIGVPKTMFALSEDDQVSVIEMGMNHFGELSRLTSVVKPDFAVITNIGTAHIEHLESREGILKAKLEILEGLKPEGTVIINGDEPLLMGKKQDNWITFGFDPRLDYCVSNVVTYGAFTEAVVYTPNSVFKIKIPSPGVHMALNALIAIIIAEKLEIPRDKIIKGIANYKSEKMRMNITNVGNFTVIDDTYNANYDSMVAAMKVLGNYLTKNRKIAILGDIFELGKYSESIHRNLGEYIASSRINCVFTIGDAAAYITDAIINSPNNKNVTSKHFKNKELFIKEWSQYINAGDIVLVKASRGMHLEEVVKAMRKDK